VFTGNDGEYGSARVHAELIEREPWREGLSVNTVAERMAVLGLRAKRRPRRRSLTRPEKTAPVFANLWRATSSRSPRMSRGAGI
jgi:transposase InsO family protein